MDLNWKEEANGVIKDIKPLVKEICIAHHQPDRNNMMLLNLRTYEDKMYCVKLCVRGFGVIAEEFDYKGSDSPPVWFETFYSLLSRFSPSFESRFNALVSEKLASLSQNCVHPS